MPKEIFLQFDNVKQVPIGGEELSDLLTGMTVCCTEPIYSPGIAGVSFYLTGKDKYICVDMGHDPFSETGFYLCYAEIKKGE